MISNKSYRYDVSELVKGLREVFPTEIELSGVPGDGGCVCKVHRPYVPEGQTGCAVQRIGTWFPIASSVRGNGRVCLVEEGVVVNDAKFVKVVLAVTDSPVCLSCGSGIRFRRFATGRVLDLSSFGAGYCYIGLIIEGFRTRVARILGPVPLVADVARVFITAGIGRFVNCKVVKVGSGRYHVQYDKNGQDAADILSYLFRILKREPGARIGADEASFSWEECVPTLRESGLSALRRVAFNSGSNVSVGSVGVDPSGEGVVYCKYCAIHVDEIGHRQSCGLVDGRLHTWPSKNYLALVGDALVKMDVVTVVLCANMDSTEVGSAISWYVSNQFQRSYWNLQDRSILQFQPSGSSDHSYGTAFEANYGGEFRSQFIGMVAGMLGVGIRYRGDSIELVSRRCGVRMLAAA